MHDKDETLHAVLKSRTGPPPAPKEHSRKKKTKTKRRNILYQPSLHNRLVRTLTNESVDNFFSIKIMFGASHEIGEVT